MSFSAFHFAQWETERRSYHAYRLKREIFVDVAADKLCVREIAYVRNLVLFMFDSILRHILFYVPLCFYDVGGIHGACSGMSALYWCSTVAGLFLWKLVDVIGYHQFSFVQYFTLFCD